MTNIVYLATGGGCDLRVEKDGQGWSVMVKASGGEVVRWPDGSGHDWATQLETAKAKGEQCARQAAGSPTLTFDWRERMSALSGSPSRAVLTSPRAPSRLYPPHSAN